MSEETQRTSARTKAPEVQKDEKANDFAQERLELLLA